MGGVRQHDCTCACTIRGGGGSPESQDPRSQYRPFSPEIVARRRRHTEQGVKRVEGNSIRHDLQLKMKH